MGRAAVVDLPDHTPAKISARTAFAISSVLPVAAYLLSRVLLIGVNKAEFTDGYQLLTWSFVNPVRWHPLYPLLLKPFLLWIDPILAGRLVSIASGFGAMLILGKTAKLLYGKNAGTLAMWLYVVSPLFLWANLRVLTESTFQLLFCMSIYHLVQWSRSGFPDQDPPHNVIRLPSAQFSAVTFVFFSGLAYLARPEGIVLFPIVFFVLGKSRLRPFWQTAASLLPWVLSFLWSFGVNSSDRYSDIVVSGLKEFQWHHAFTRLVSYVEVYPYVLFYPVFAVAIFNVLRSSINRHWKWILFYVHLSFAAMLFVHPAWTTRLLFIPVSLFLVEASAGLLRVRRSFQVAVLGGSLLFSLAALFLQSAMFLDFKEAAVAVKGSYGERRVVSDEQAKTEFYLQKAVFVYDKVPLKPGDILILHSYNTDLQAARKLLDRHYRYVALLSTEAQIVPLLGNAALADINFTNSPVALVQRFQKQPFQTVIVRIDGTK